jgi:hypothetical protein
MSKNMMKFHNPGGTILHLIEDKLVTDVYFESARVRHIKMRDSYRIIK